MKSCLDNKGFIVNEDTQFFIESFILNEYVSSDNENTNYIGKVNTNILDGVVGKYIQSKENMFVTYINNLDNNIKQEMGKSRKKERSLFYI